MFNHRLTRRMVITFFCLLTFPVAAQDRYFGDLDGFWDEAFSWEGGVVPSAGENAFLVRPYFGFVPAIQPLLVDFRSATDPELGTLVIESSNWLIQNELPGLDQLTSFREIIGGYDGELLGTVESVDNPSHRSSHIQNGGTNRVVFLTIGGVPGSGGRYLLGGGFLRAGSVVVGNAGIGEIHQTEGFLDSSSFVLGRFASGSGTLTIDGGRLEVTDSDLSVGPVGFGNIAHSGDAEVLVDRDLLLGSTENSTSWGEYEFSSTSFLNVGGDIYIGRGNFRHMGGDVFIGGDLVVEPAGAYLINGASTLEMTGAIDLAGQVGQQGGQMNVASTVNISAGLYSQSAGTHRVGQSLKVGNEESRTGFYRLQDGTMDVMQDTYIGSNGGFGEFTHENGTHIVNGSLVLGYEADFETFPNVIGEIGIGSYTITDGEVRADRLHMGDSGLGEFPTFEFDQFTQDGGVVRLEKEVVIGFGVYELNDGELYSAPVDATDPLRLLYENNALIVGGLARGDSVEPGGNWLRLGNFNQTGGRNIVQGDLTVAAHRQTNGVYTLENGSLEVSGDVFINGRNLAERTGLFEHHGGTSTITGDFWNYGTTRLRAGQMIVNEFHNEGLVIGGSADFEMITSGETLFNNGSYIVTGPGNMTIRGAVENNSTFELTDASIQFVDEFTNRGSVTSVRSTSTYGHLTIDPTGYLQAGAGDQFVVVGDFVNGSLQINQWKTDKAALEFSGAAEHLFGLSSDDLGATISGFRNNFAWGLLSFADGESLTLVDGNSDAGAALYLSVFMLQNLQQLGSVYSDFNIYYDARKPGNDYLQGQIYELNGSGRLIPVVPESGAGVAASILLIGIACRRTHRRRFPQVIVSRQAV